MAFRRGTSVRRCRCGSEQMRRAFAPRHHAPDGHLADRGGARASPIGVEGGHVTIRLENDRLAAFSVVGTPPDETQEMIASEEGDHESTENWVTVLRDLKTPGCGHQPWPGAMGLEGCGRRV
jgi:hypothetical protein